MRGRKENATHEAAAGRDIFPVAIFEKACYNSLQTCGYSSSVERQLPKLHRWVRLPLAAPARRKRHIACDEFLCFTSKTRPALILLLLLSKPNPLRWASVWLWKRPFHEIEYLSNCCVSSQASYRLRRVFYASHQNASRAPLRRVCGRAAEAKPQKPPPGLSSRGWFLQMLSRCNSSCARRWRTPGPGSGCCWGGKCWYRRRSSPPRCLRRSAPAHTHQRCR